MLKVEFKNVQDFKELPPISDFRSGTIVEFVDEYGTDGYGMIMTDCDGDNYKVWDFEMNEYYDDYEDYRVVRKLNATITIEN